MFSITGFAFDQTQSDSRPDCCL